MSTVQRRVTVVASTATVTALAPLLEVWRTEGSLRLVDPGEHLPTYAALVDLAADADAVLVAGSRGRAPRTVLPGPVLRTATGTLVPVAWLPDTGFLPVRRFAETAAVVHARGAGRRRSVAVLGQRHRRFDDLAGRVVRLLDDERGKGALVECRRWTAYEVHRDDLVRRLGRGPALAVYLGHGRPVGWVGYAGVRAHQLGPRAYARWRPGAALLSLTCKTASRRGTGLSFTEAVPLSGIAAAAVGAVGPTLHTANARWALRICRSLANVDTIGELLVRVAALDPQASSYRLVGDPTAPLHDDEAMTDLADHACTDDHAYPDDQEVAS